MRRFFGLVLLCSAFSTLWAAAPSSGSPSPALTPGARLVTPTPIPTRVLPKGATPTVIIYPFTTPSDVDAKTGNSIAQIFSNVIAQGGEITVLPIPANVKREDFTKYALSKGADYYISGYVQPIGSGAAVVSQVYDVSGQVSIYSTTSQITSVNDLASQGVAARQIVMQASGVDKPDIATDTASAQPAPGASDGTSVSINNVLGGIFHGKKKTANTVATTATPQPKPSRAMILTRVGGNAAAAVLARAQDDTFRALDAHYNVSRVDKALTDAAHQSDAICGTHRDTTVSTGSLNVTHVSGFRAHDAYTFKLTVYTCFGAQLATYSTQSDNYGTAISQAVDSLFTDHPDNS